MHVPIEHRNPRLIPTSSNNSAGRAPVATEAALDGFTAKWRARLKALLTRFTTADDLFTYTVRLFLLAWGTDK